MVATVNASTSAGVVITPDNSGVLAFQSSSATALTIDASQNSTFVGTASATKLIPTGSSATGNGLYLPAANSLGLSTNGTNAVYIDSSQNVGIGGAVTNEGGYARVLQVTGSTDCALELKGGSSYSYVAQNGTTLQIRNNATSGVMTFATESTERMRILSTGQVNINQTGDTNAFLVVNGGGNHAIRTLRDGTANATQISFANGNGTVGSITTSGSATAYNTSSDYRLKEAITPMTGALAKVAQLKPVTYKWKVDGSDGEGFIAHELAEVCPHAVSGEKDAIDADGNPDYQAVDTSFLVATLTAAIQELKAINDTLTARIVALENR